MSQASITPELYELIVKIVEDKVRDIRVTREEFEKLTAAVRQLAEAQRRTEERLNELAKRVDQLAETVGVLSKSVDSLRREFGKLTDTIGFGLEDIAKVVLPGWLHRHLNVEVENLERRYLTVDGRVVEVNLYGEGVQEGEKVLIVGEAKSRIYGRDVLRFYNEVYRPMASRSEVRVIGILFGYLIHPSAQKEAEQRGLYVVASYQR